MEQRLSAAGGHGPSYDISRNVDALNRDGIVGLKGGFSRAWTERMASRGVLAHNDSLFTAASHRNLKLKAIGENVGWNYSVAAQHAAFVASPGHRANLDKAGFRVAGFAVVRAADGRIWSTEDFGTPS